MHVPTNDLSACHLGLHEISAVYPAEASEEFKGLTSGDLEDRVWDLQGHLCH